MIYPKKAAKQILSDGLFSFLLDEMLESAGKKTLDEGEVAKMLESGTEWLQEYKRLNRDAGVSNIHLAYQEIREEDSLELSEARKKLNSLVSSLKNLEKYESPPAKGVMSMWIGFVFTMLIFMAHNVFAMFTEIYETKPIIAYGTFAAISGFGIWFFFNRLSGHSTRHLAFTKIETSLADTIEHGRDLKYWQDGDLFDSSTES